MHLGVSYRISCILSGSWNWNWNQIWGSLSLRLLLLLVFVWIFNWFWITVHDCTMQRCNLTLACQYRVRLQLAIVVDRDQEFIDSHRGVWKAIIPMAFMLIVATARNTALLRQIWPWWRLFLQCLKKIIILKMIILFLYMSYIVSLNRCHTCCKSPEFSTDCLQDAAC